MNPMHKAIRGRRSQDSQGDHGGMSHHGEHSDDPKKDLHSMVASLSDNEKSQLKGILNSSDNSVNVSKGEPTSHEKQMVAQQSAEENQEEGMEDDGAIDSDQIAKDMLDSKFSRGGPSKPRNLHERVQMNMASNLKSKGKL